MERSIEQLSLLVAWNNAFHAFQFESSALKTKKVDQWSTFYICLNMQLQMHELFLLQQIFFSLSVFRIVYTTVNWTYRSALWLIVETNTLGAFV